MAPSTWTTEPCTASWTGVNVTLSTNSQEGAGKWVDLQRRGQNCEITPMHGMHGKA